MKLVICSSASFYKFVLELKRELEAAGIEVVVPKSAHTMAKYDFDTTKSKTWFNNPDDYDIKADLMRSHFDEISNGDAILVVNNEKHSQSNYIGANVLLEMGTAWYQNKPIYLLNDLPENTPFEEEIKGMMPTVLHGDITKLRLANYSQTK